MKDVFFSIVGNEVSFSHFLSLVSKK